MGNEMTFNKERFIKLMISNIEYHSSTPERAKEYLSEEGYDVDKVIDDGLRRIKELQDRLKTKDATRPADENSSFKASNYKRKWHHKSVLQLMEEAHTDDPIEEIKIRARDLVMAGFEKGWNGPPYSAVQLAELVGIDVMPSDEVIDACIVPQKNRLQILYNPFQPANRINFSVSHEIAHSLFTDCGDAIRNREFEPAENRELEQLCNAAAAEIQLPYAIFSHDANSMPPSIEGLIDLAKRYRASLESVFLRYTEVIDKECAVLVGVFQDDKHIVVDYHKTARKFRYSLPYKIEIPSDSKAYECTSPGWTAREQISWSVFNNEKFNMFAVGISPYRKDKLPRVGILILPVEVEKYSLENGKIVIEVGDATQPRGKGKKIIAQVVNTGGSLARGFGYSLTKAFPIVQEKMTKWKANKSEFQLGANNLIKISEELFVVQMLAQKGLYGTKKDNEIPLKYKELRKCLIELRQTALELGASVHMPAIGSGNAGGDWNIIIGMIHDELVNYDVKVNIYLLQPKKIDPKENMTLTIIKGNSTWETGKLF